MSIAACPLRKVRQMRGGVYPNPTTEGIVGMVTVR
jgi:hypothetical protein